MLADKLMREKSLADQVKVTVSTSHWKQRGLGVDGWGSGLGSGQGCCVTLGKPLALSEPLPTVLAFQALGGGGWGPRLWPGAEAGGELWILGTA